MKRTTIIKTMLAVAIMMLVCGCSSEEIISDIASENKTVPISVTDTGFVSAVGGKTRTAESGTKTTFTNGDAIGIYVMDGSTVKYTNLKYTYDATNKVWTNTTYGANVPFILSGKYFAYYPYKDTYTAAATDVAATATTAETFFAPIITTWTPATDQSTQANYTAQDLMVAQGETSTNGYVFSLTHQMAMVEVDLAQEKFILDGGVPYKYSFDTYQPYNIEDGKYRMLVKPDDANMSIGGKIYATPTAQTGVWSVTETSPDKAKCKVYTLDGKAASLSDSYVGVGVGSLYYSDGTCANELINGKTPIGVVVSTNSTYCEPTADNGKYGHGLVMALGYASKKIQWKIVDTDAGLPKCGSYKALYNDKSGLTNQTKVGISDTYPAFKAAYDYLSEAHPTTSSCWFLPTVGQWWDAIEQAATKNGKILTISSYHDDSSSLVGNYINSDVIVVDALNKLMSNYSGLDYEKIEFKLHWASTEHNDYTSFIVQFSSSDGLCINSSQKNADERCVRPFLAF